MPVGYEWPYFTDTVKFEEKKYGQLQCLEIEGGGSQAPLTVILLHGYGADMGDLASVVRILKAPPHTRWIFPNAPLAVPLGPNFEGRAWFPLRLAELEQMAAGGAPLDFTELKPPGLKAAHQSVLDLMAKAGVNPGKTCLGGFSQGSMVATDITLRHRDMFAGLIILSGTLVCANEWRELAKSKGQLRYLQSHGEIDPDLPLNLAERLHREVLQAGGMSGEFIRFRGGHEIPLPVLNKLSSFLLSL